MNNFMISIKRFFKNKNTVTILGVMAIIGIIYGGYVHQIGKAVEPMQIPVADKTIQPRTKIIREMIKTIDVATIAVPENVYQSESQIIGKYSNYNTMIPAGSMFYKEALVDEKDLPDSAFVEVPAGQVPYNFPVSMDSTYGNSIFPGNYIDIYMKAVNEEGKLMVGKLFENINVLAVKDSSGKNVFENSEESREPAFLIFGLTPEYNILLRKASYMYSYSVELFPVPHGATIDAEGSTLVSSQTLKDFINANTVANDELVTSSTDATNNNASVTQ